MNSEIKIPTLLGIGVLTLGLVIGIFLVTTSQVLKSRASQSSSPQNITLTNVSSNHVSVFWQTDQEVPGFIQSGTTTSLGETFTDERDTKAPQSHQVHFITLTSLTPNTVYYYKINSGSESYPAKDTFSFKTPMSITPSNTQPLIGSVIDTNLQPVTEAVATLEIPGGQTLSAVTKTAGNFVIPLAEIYNQQLDNNFVLGQTPITAKLTVSDFVKSSQIIFQLPLTGTLPPITLGENVDLTTPSDLNHDGIINSLDRAR